jgi:hypothetical protein
MDGRRAKAQQRWAALDAAEERLQQAPARAARVHAELLRDVLEVAAAYRREGQDLSVGPQVGLLLRSSGAKADRLLTEAMVLAELPEGFAALEHGLLTMEQSATVAVELGRVPDLATRLVVWRRLLERLRADVASGAVLSPPRLRELLRRWVLELAPADAVEEREQAAAERRVEYRRRDDGLADIFLMGVNAALAQAVLCRIRELSEPVSLFDDRTADQRRLDTAVDLLLGRVGGPSGVLCQRNAGSSSSGSSAAGSSPAGSGRVGRVLAVAACRVVRSVRRAAADHVPLGAALGTTNEVAVQSGHGPVEPDVLQEMLLAAPQLRAVFVDADGVPVSVSDQVRQPQRRDPRRSGRCCSTWLQNHHPQPSPGTPTIIATSRPVRIRRTPRGRTGPRGGSTADRGSGAVVRVPELRLAGGELRCRA